MRVSKTENLREISLFLANSSSDWDDTDAYYNPSTGNGSDSSDNSRPNVMYITSQNKWSNRMPLLLDLQKR